MLLNKYKLIKYSRSIWKQIVVHNKWKNKCLTSLKFDLRIWNFETCLQDIKFK